MFDQRMCLPLPHLMTSVGSLLGAAQLDGLALADFWEPRLFSSIGFSVFFFPETPREISRPSGNLNPPWQRSGLVAGECP